MTMNIATPPQSTIASDLLVKAAALGMLVYVKAERLVIVGPSNADVSLIEQLQRNKAVLLPLLRVDLSNAERFEERAAIAEYKGGLSTGEAEALAWREWRARKRCGTPTRI